MVVFVVFVVFVVAAGAFVSVVVPVVFMMGAISLPTSSSSTAGQLTCLLMKSSTALSDLFSRYLVCRLLVTWSSVLGLRY